jgi:hypothetical protein
MPCSVERKAEPGVQPNANHHDRSMPDAWSGAGSYVPESRAQCPSGAVHSRSDIPAERNAARVRSGPSVKWAQPSAVSVTTAVVARSAHPGLAQAHVFIVFAALLVLMLPLVKLVPEHSRRLVTR